MLCQLLSDRICRAEYEGSKLLRIVSIYLQVHTALQPRKPTVTYTAVRTLNLI
jgi:hypothetical protein